MAGSVNKVILVGNLGKDPEVRHGTDGAKIVSLSVATSDSWKDKSTGEKRNKTEWHKVVVFNDKLADVCEKYLKQGSNVYLEGQLQTRKWTDKQGQDRYTTEIVLAKFKGEITLLNSRGNGVSEDQGSFQDKQSFTAGSHKIPSISVIGEPLNDEVPF